jgi:hypothetical protein
MPNNSERKVYHVTHNGDKGWKVKREGAARASDYFDNKSDAVERGGSWHKAEIKGKL